MAQSQRPAGMGRRALRLTFAYDGEEVTLTRAEPLEKRTPPSDPLIRGGQATHRSGFWVEVRDDENRVLWRRRLHDPRNPSVEVPAEGRAGRFERVDVDQPAGSFRVLVPDLPTAKRVTVVASTPLGRGGRSVDEAPHGARPIGTFDLVRGE